MKKNLLIIYHSQSGSTAKMAEAIRSGCLKEEDIDIRYLNAFTADLDDLLWADGLIFGTPENFGYMSGALKDFFDRTFYPAESYKINLPYGVFVSSGNDGTGAVREIDRIVRGYPLRKICDPLIIVGRYKSEHATLCEEFGLSIATGLSLGIF